MQRKNQRTKRKKLMKKVIKNHENKPKYIKIKKKIKKKKKLMLPKERKLRRSPNQKKKWL